MYLPTSRQMRELDRLAIEQVGIPGAVLMENAGRGTVDHMVSCFGPAADKTVIVFAGPGNNGGDGLVIARTAVSHRAHPHIFLLADPQALSGDALLNYQIAEKMGLSCTIVGSGKDLAGAEELILDLHAKKNIHSIVDALFGIGLTRKVEGRYKHAIDLMNRIKTRLGSPITAVDIPSGLNSDTGEVMGDSVLADLTVTYGFPKPGHYHNGGSGTGELRVVDIGIPPTLLSQETPEGSVLNWQSVPPLKQRDNPSHKGSNGHLLILSGSIGKTGAATLCARGALHSGAGLVTLGVPAALNTIFEVSLPEAMTVPFAGANVTLSESDYSGAMSLMKDKQCLVTGPGIGTGKDTAALVERLYTEVTQPMVLDADALNILAQSPERCSLASGPRILTPHPGEMARLLGISVAEIQADRLEAARRLTEEVFTTGKPVITILKGAGTVIYSDKGRWCINDSGNPGMGAGGMGDVLAGIIGSFICQGYGIWEAACLGVFLHGRSADDLALEKPYGYTASDVAVGLPETIGRLLKHQSTIKNNLTTT